MKNTCGGKVMMMDVDVDREMKTEAEVDGQSMRT